MLVVYSISRKVKEWEGKQLKYMGELISDIFYVDLLIHFVAFWCCRLEMCFRKLYITKLFR